MFDNFKKKIAEPNFQQGQKLNSQKNYEASINEYKKAIAIYPKYIEAYRGLDYDYYDLNDYNNDLKTMQKIIALEPNNSGNYSDLGITYDSLNNMHKAIESYQRAISLNPNKESYYVNLAKDYKKIKNYKAEILNYKRAINFTSKDNYFNEIGIAYDNLNNHRQAVVFYKDAIKCNPKDDVLYSNLARSLYDLRDYNGEINALKQAIQIKRKSSYYNRIGVAYNRMKDNEMAKRYYQQAISMNGNVATYYANLSYMDSNASQKVSDLKTAININPNRAVYYKRLGDVYYQNNKYQSAYDCYKKLVSLDNKNPAYYKRLADSENYLANYGWPVAIKTYGQAIQLKPDYQAAIFARSLDNHNLGNYTSEAKDLKTLITLNPKKNVYLNNLGFDYHLLGKDKEALPYLKKALLIKNNSVSENDVATYCDNIARTEFTIGKKETNDGNVQSANKYYKESIFYCRKTISIDSQFQEAYYVLGLDYRKLGQYKTSIKVLNNLIKLNNGNAYFYKALGDAYRLINDNNRAVSCYRSATSVDGKLSNHQQAVLYKRLADAESKVKSNRSTDDYRKAVKLDPDKPGYRDALKKNIHQIQLDFNFDDVDQYNENINYMTQLNRLVGLKDVAKQLEKFVMRYDVEKAKSGRNNHGMMHLVFEGAPGTGKTLVAKLFSHLLAQKGMVQPNQYVGVSAADFRSKYQGQGTKKVTKCIKNSINGVLFIDEAYILGSNEDSVREAADKMLTEIQDHKNDIVVILAGYRDKMKEFFNNGNQGLTSRFPTVITFPNYTNQDCLKLLHMDLVQKKMRVDSESTRDLLTKEFTNWISVNRHEQGDKFGNARTVKNCCQKLIDNVDARVDIQYHNELKELSQEHSDKLYIITANDVEKTFNHHYEADKQKKNHDYLKDLNALIGLNSVKQQVQTEINKVKAQKRLGSTSGHGNINSIFEGDPGTGKTTVAKLLGKILYQKGIAQNDNFKYVNATELQSTLVGGSAERMRTDIQDAMGGVLFIDEAYALSDKHMKPVVNTLLTAAEDYKNDLVIILAGYTKQMENLRNYVNPGFKSRFRKTIVFPDYTASECQQIFDLFMHKDGLKFDSASTHNMLNSDLKQYISIKKSEDQGDFANAREVRNIYGSVKDTFDNRIALMPDSAFKKLKASGSVKIISADDVKNTFNKYHITNKPREEIHSHRALDQLNQLIGLNSVKHQVKSYIRTRKIDAVLGKHSNPGIDMVFEGAPGTGKTTVARLFAHILYDIGMVKTTKFKEIQGSDLTGQYLGQTKKKARKIIHSALGGVLFIDEAYTLAHEPNATGGTNDYKDAAVAELIAEVENHRKDLAVIMAGYTPQMKNFFKYSNPGLTRRFKDRIIFKGYNNDECFQILQLMLNNNDIKMSSGTEPILKRQFYQAVTSTRQNEGIRFGNGGYVRNVADKLIAAKNNRLAVLPYKTLLNIKGSNPDELHTLTSDDINKTFSSLSNQ